MDIKKLAEAIEVLKCLEACSPETSPKTDAKERPVVVCTEYRGVFFGYATDTDAETLILKRARCALYWSKDVGGFIGLAEKGPTSNCRISARADIKVTKVTCVLEVTESAMKAWESASCVS